MMERRTLGWIPMLCVFVAPSAVAQTVHVQEPVADSRPAGPKLVFIRGDSTGPFGERLAKCERLTIEKYEASGTRVTVMSDADLKRWLEGDGREYARGHKYFQELAYARSQQADAIGGLYVADWKNDQGKPVFAGWGIAINACTRYGCVTNENEADSIRAIPLLRQWSSEAGNLVDAWAVPIQIEPMPARPFLGISLDGTQVTAVTAESPAAEAGLSAGDMIVALDGQPVTNQDSLSEILRQRKPGDEIRVEYKRSSTTSNKTVRLARFGKPMPSLVATDIEGREVKLTDLKGKVVLLQFWATWCIPCKHQMPSLQLLWERARDKDFVFVNVSVDENESAWKDFVRHNKLGGVQVRSSEWGDGLGVEMYPMYVLIDRAGVERYRHTRGDLVVRAAWAMLDEKR